MASDASKILIEQEETEITKGSVFFVNRIVRCNGCFLRHQNLTREVIGTAIEVHREKEPGLLESIYESCLKLELGWRGYHVKTQESAVVHWKQFRKEYPLRFDLLINDFLLVELKAVEAVKPIHKAQLLSYMKLVDIPLRLIIRFNEKSWSTVYRD